MKHRLVPLVKVFFSTNASPKQFSQRIAEVRFGEISEIISVLWHCD